MKNSPDGALNSETTKIDCTSRTWSIINLSIAFHSLWKLSSFQQYVTGVKWSHVCESSGTVRIPESSTVRRTVRRGPLSSTPHFCESSRQYCTVRKSLQRGYSRDSDKSWSFHIVLRLLWNLAGFHRAMQRNSLYSSMIGWRILKYPFFRNAVLPH